MMKEKNEGMHFPKVTPDNYFMTQEERDAEKLEKIQISLSASIPYSFDAFAKALYSCFAGSNTKKGMW